MPHDVCAQPPPNHFPALRFGPIREASPAHLDDRRPAVCVESKGLHLTWHEILSICHLDGAAHRPSKSTWPSQDGHRPELFVESQKPPPPAIQFRVNSR